MARSKKLSSGKSVKVRKVAGTDAYPVLGLTLPVEVLQASGWRIDDIVRVNVVERPPSKAHPRGQKVLSIERRT